MRCTAAISLLNSCFHPKAAEGSMKKGSVTASAHRTPPVVAGDPAASSHTMRASPITVPSVVPELQAHHPGVAGVQLLRQPRPAAAGRNVVHTFGHLGCVFAEPIGVPAQRAVIPVAAVEPAG